MVKKITDAEAQAMVQAANSSDPAAAKAARRELARWISETVEFDCPATQRWVQHSALIYGVES